MAQLWALAKGNYFPFPTEHLEALATLVAPANRQGSFIDPCAGKGEAALSLAKAWGLTPYLNELDAERAAICQSLVGSVQAVQGDVMRLRAPKNFYDAAWINPPYTEDGVGPEKRREFAVLKQAWPWLRQDGGLIMWCVYAQHVTTEAARWISQRTSSAQVWRIPGLHQEHYVHVVLVARVGVPEDAKALENELLRQVRTPDMKPLLAQPTPVYFLPRHALTARKITFLPGDLDPTLIAAAVDARGAQHGLVMQSALRPHPPRQKISPIVTPRGRQFAMLLMSGLLDGVTLRDEDGQTFAMRSTVETVEVETDHQTDDDGNEKETWQTQAVVTLSLLDERGRHEEIVGETDIAVFIRRHREQLIATTDHDLAPLYRFDYADIQDVLGYPKKGGLYPTQRHVIAAAYQAFRQGKRSVLIAGEPGVGKSVIGATVASALARHDPTWQIDDVVVITCPPHLVPKWVRELKDAIHDVRVHVASRVDDVAQFMRDTAVPDLPLLDRRLLVSLARNIGEASLPLAALILNASAAHVIRRKAARRINVIVLSREYAKLGEGWEPAIVWRKQYVKGIRGQVASTLPLLPLGSERPTLSQLLEPVLERMPADVALADAEMALANALNPILGDLSILDTDQPLQSADEQARVELTLAALWPPDSESFDADVDKPLVAMHNPDVSVVRIAACPTCGNVIRGAEQSHESKRSQRRARRPGQGGPRYPLSYDPNAEPHPDLPKSETVDEGLILGDANWWTKVPRFCNVCGNPLWSLKRTFSKPKGRSARTLAERLDDQCAPGTPNPRVPLAHYLAQRHKKRLALYIPDEVHEEKDPSTDQGEAFMVLANAARRVLPLTGTLYDGTASSIYAIEYTLNQRVRSEYPWGSMQRWIKNMGTLERIIETKSSIDSSGTYSGKRRIEHRAREVPGTSPLLIAEIVDHVIMVGLQDMGKPMPDFEEIPVEFEMPERMRSEYDRGLGVMKRYLNECRLEKDATFMGKYLQVLLSWPNAAFREERVYHNRPVADETIPVHVHDWPAIHEPNEPTAKDRWLIELINDELERGRNVAVYVRQSGTRNIQDRLAALIKTHLPCAKPFILRKVPPLKREEMLAKQVAKGANVLICNPELVKTGLDLLDFPTIVFYEPVYSLYTMGQAARRAWRLIQTKECRVYYPYWADSMEQSAIALVAAKTYSTNLLLGEATDIGLSILGRKNANIDGLVTEIANLANNDLRTLFARHASDVQESAWLDNPQFTEQIMTLAVTPALVQSAFENSTLVHEPLTPLTQMTLF